MYVNQSKWMDRNIEIIFKKFQFKLKISPESIQYAKKLYEDLMEKNLFKYESPYLIVAICVYTVLRIGESPKSVNEISDVCHLKEESLKEGYNRVFQEIESSLKKL